MDNQVSGLKRKRSEEDEDYDDPLSKQLPGGKSWDADDSDEDEDAIEKPKKRKNV